jgi:hypothetical protein
MGDVMGDGTESALGPATRSVPLGPVTVTAHGLRIRRTPDATVDDNIVGGLHYHAIVIALARDGEWLRIDYQGQPAFIHGDYVQAVAKPSTHR